MLDRSSLLRWLGKASLLIGGVGLGVALSSNARAPAPAASASPASAPPSDLRPASPRAAEPSVPPALLRRLEALEARAAHETQDPKATAEPSPTVGPPVNPFSPEQKQAATERWSARLEQHRSEPVDPTWAPKVSRALGDDLRPLSEAAGFSLGPIDCRMTSCTAVARWPSYEEAKQRFQALTRHDYKANCGRVMMLPEPPDPFAPYEASLLLDCESARADGRIL